MLLKKRYIPKYYQSIHFFLKNNLLALLLFSLCISATDHSAYATSWKKIKPGLLYKVFMSDGLNIFSKIHVIDVDLTQVKLFFCHVTKVTSTHNALIENKASVAVNGAFFDTNSNPIGLRVSKGNVLSPYKKISWWRTFSIKNNIATIGMLDSLNLIKQLDFAIQTGPELINNYQIPQLKTSYASRTAIGIKKNNHILLLVTENAFITTKYLAKFMKDTLKCKSAINLDGGGSTQMSIKTNHFSYQINGLTKLPDPICLQ